MAEDVAPRRDDAVFALQRRIGGVASYRPGGGVIRHGPFRHAVPGENAARIATRVEVALGQQAAGVGGGIVSAAT